MTGRQKRLWFLWKYLIPTADQQRMEKIASVQCSPSFIKLEMRLTLSEVTKMVLIEVCSVVMLTTGLFEQKKAKVRICTLLSVQACFLLAS